MHIPERVKRTPPIYKTPEVTAWYAPANTRRDLPPGSKARGAMDDLLLSKQIQEPIMEAAKDMADDARELAISEGLVESGGYVSSFGHHEGEVVTVNDGSYANPRVSAVVENTDPVSPAIEFGNSRTRARRILGRVAAKHTSPKGGVSE
jgi:hypothetical protein